MAGTVNVDIVSPDGKVFRGEVARVRAPGVEGSFEVLHNHAPMIAAFGIGPIVLTTTSGERIAYATSGGFLEVVDNHVSILAETAEPGSAIDVQRARESEARAVEALKAGGVDRTEAELALQKARNRLRVAMGGVGADHK
jgi:F-type H+-transporting ATPase subunit epsilon